MCGVMARMFDKMRSLDGLYIKWVYIQCDYQNNEEYMLEICFDVKSQQIA